MKFRINFALIIDFLCGANVRGSPEFDKGKNFMLNIVQSVMAKVVKEWKMNSQSL